MKKITFLFSLSAMALFGMAHAEILPEKPVLEAPIQSNIIKIEGVGNKRTIEGKGNEIIRIEGANNEIVLKGNVTKIIIHGTENSISGGNAKSVEIEGASNKITIGSIESVKIQGTQNHVHYTATKNKNGKVAASTEGIDNMVMKVK